MKKEGDFSFALQAHAKLCVILILCELNPESLANRRSRYETPAPTLSLYQIFKITPARTTIIPTCASIEKVSPNRK